MGLLRILLAICVFCGHTRQLGHLHWLRADFAVELFFVISGFYMQLVLSSKYSKAKLGPRWRLKFYKARYLRLFPAYALACLISLGLAIVRHNRIPPIVTWAAIRGLPNTASNFFFKAFLCLTSGTMFFQDLTMFFSAKAQHIRWSANFWDSAIPLWQGLPIPQAWSLGIELNFYLIAPFLLTLRARWLAIASLCGLALKAFALTHFNLGDPWTYRFFPFEIAYFLLGALAFRCWKSKGHLLPPILAKYSAYPLAAAFVLAPLSETRLAFLTLPVALACSLPLLFQATSGMKADQAIGALSYPFYIFHMLVILPSASLISHLHAPSNLAVYTALVVTLLASITVSAAEKRFVDPWRDRFAHERPYPGVPKIFSPDTEGSETYVAAPAESTSRSSAGQCT